MRVILLHPKSMEDPEINALMLKLAEASGPQHTVTSGRDVYQRVASRMGNGGTGWNTFSNDVARDYEVFVIPGTQENPTVGQGTAKVLEQVVKLNKIIQLWNPSTNHWWAIRDVALGTPQNGRATYTLVPKPSPMGVA